MVFDGRLPSNTPCGTSQSGVPSALTSLGGLAEGQRLGLGEDVGHQHVVMPAERVQGLGEGDEVAGDEPRALVDQLVEGVLAVGAGLAPVDRPGVVVHRRAVERDVLAVALHGELLEIGGKALAGTARRAARATVWAPKKLLYQTASRPISTGRLRSNGAVRKCSSISWKPPSMARKLSGPMASMVESPMAESIE